MVREKEQDSVKMYLKTQMELKVSSESFHACIEQERCNEQGGVEGALSDAFRP